MPIVSPVINRGVVSYWLDTAPTGGKLVTIDSNGNVREATAAEVRTAGNLAAVAASGSASDLTTGTLADARLSSNVPLKNAANVFTSVNTFNGNIAAFANFDINHPFYPSLPFRTSMSGGAVVTTTFNGYEVYRTEGHTTSIKGNVSTVNVGNAFFEAKVNNVGIEITPEWSTDKFRIVKGSDERFGINFTTGVATFSNNLAALRVNISANDSWLGFTDTHNYLSNTTYFRTIAGGTKVTIDGATGEAVFNGLISSPRVYVSGTNPQISPLTSDGSDNRTLLLMGGGEYGPTNRGPHISLHGLEAASRPGNIELWAGLNGQIRLGGEQGGGHTIAMTVTAAGVTQLATDRWHQDSNGAQRLYYWGADRTIIKGHGGQPIEFRNAADSTIGYYSEGIGWTLSGSLSSSFVFPVNSWQVSAGGEQRLYFAGSGASLWKGHGALPHEFRNGTDVALARMSNTGELKVASAIAANNISGDIAALGSGIAYYGLGHTTLYGATSGVGAQIYLGDINFSNSAYWNSAPGIGAVGGHPTSELAFYVYVGNPNSRDEAGRFKSNKQLELRAGITNGINGTLAINSPGVNGRIGFSVNPALQTAMLIAEGANVQFRNDNWHGSITDGLDRFLYAFNSTTYYKGHGAGTVHEWRNGSDSNVMSLSQLGNLLVNGTVQIGNSTGPILANVAGTLDVKNATNTDWGRVNANEFRLASNTFSRVAQLNSATGGWGGGYNFNVNGGTFNRDSTGTVNAVFYNVGAIQWFSEGSAAPAVITPRMTLSPTGLVVVGRIDSGNGSSLGATGTDNALRADNTYIQSADGGNHGRFTMTSATAGASFRMGWTTAHGGVSMDTVPVAAGNTGYFAWYKPSGTRQGYMGYDVGPDISLTLEQAGGRFTVMNGNINIQQAILIKRSVDELQIKDNTDSAWRDIQVRVARFNSAGGQQFVINGTDLAGTTGSYMYLTSGSSHFYLRTAGATYVPLLLVNNSCLFSPNVWHGDNVDLKRLFFVGNGSTYYMGYGVTPHEWRDGAEAPIARMSNTGDFQINGRYQIGGASGPLLKNNSGVVQVRNSADSAFAPVHVSQLRVGSTSGNTYSIESDGYVRTYINSATAIGYITQNSAGQWATQISTGGEYEIFLYSPSVINPFRIEQNGTVITKDHVISSTAVGKHTLRLQAITSQTSRLFRIESSGGSEIGYITPDANMQLNGHITSAFQSLSADPTTLDISAGLSRLVKNTTSGEIRWFVNDGGTIKKSAAFT